MIRYIIINLMCAMIMSFVGHAITLQHTFAAESAVMAYDDLGRLVTLENIPQRIVVLSGSPLDVLFELGAGDRIVGVMDGVTRSYPETCRRYPSLLKKPKIGRFDAPNIEKIIELSPDLIIPHASLDSPGKYTSIFEKRGLPYAGFTTIENVDVGLDQMKRMGILIGKKREAEILSRQIKKEIEQLTADIAARIEKRPMVYYWWGERNGTYGRLAAINELIEKAGGVNLAGAFDRRYMEISPEYVISKNPDVIVISYWKACQKEPRLKAIARRPGFSQIKAVAHNRIYTIDGHSFHTPVRFAETIRLLATYIHGFEWNGERVARIKTRLILDKQ